MPAELNRLLRTIKELDIKSEGAQNRGCFNFAVCLGLINGSHCQISAYLAELAAQIQENFEAVMAKSPGKGDAAEVAAMRKRIEDDQALLIQWAEEKVQLALMGHDLLEMHQEVLAQDQSALYHELTEMGLMQDDAYGVDDGYGLELQVPEPTGRRGGASRLQYAGSFDSLEPAALELRPGERRREFRAAACLLLHHHCCVAHTLLCY